MHFWLLLYPTRMHRPYGSVWSSLPACMTWAYPDMAYPVSMGPCMHDASHRFAQHSHRFVQHSSCCLPCRIYTTPDTAVHYTRSFSIRASRAQPEESALPAARRYYALRRHYPAHQLAHPVALHFVSCCDAAHICPASLPALCRIMLPSLPESRHYIMLPGFFFPSRMSLASSCLPPCTVHYIMLPGFFFPSRMSLASFTLAAMKLLPPDEGQ